MAGIREAINYYRAGRFVDAARECNSILLQDGRNFDALFLLAGIKLQQKALPDARALLKRSIAVNPNSVEAAANLAFVMSALGHDEEAITEADRALTLAPRHVGALVTRAAALTRLDRLDDALESYDRALEIDSGNQEALIGCGALLSRLGRPEDAVRMFDRIPAWDDPEQLAKRAKLKRALGMLEPAAGDFRRLTEFPNYQVRGWIGLVMCASESCDWAALEKPRQHLIDAVDKGHAAPPLLVMQLSEDPALHLKNARAVAPRLHARAATFARPAERPERLKIAYVSPDFEIHPLAYLIVELLEKHDRARFEVIGVSLKSSDRSDIRQRIEKSCDRFLEMHSCSDEQVVSQLREMGIDIAVDLAGYTEHSRPSIFALRAAPVQASYLGYCGTSGTNTIDYLLADRIVVPRSHHGFFSEKIVCLPDTFMVADSTQRVTAETPTRGANGLPEEGFVFCCFNKNYKITQPVFDLWMRLLRSVDGSVLWLAANLDRASPNLRREAERQGVDPQRLVFAQGVGDRADHLARQKLADLFLDTLPYNAHTTACDALFVGLPVITTAGPTFVGRVAASMLHALGMDELVAQNLEEYEALALALARDPARLRAIRQKLNLHRTSHPMFDTDRFRSNIEQAYDTMFEIYRAGEKPRPFDVVPQ